MQITTITYILFFLTWTKTLTWNKHAQCWHSSRQSPRSRGFLYSVMWPFCIRINHITFLLPLFVVIVLYTVWLSNVAESMQLSFTWIDDQWLLYSIKKETPRFYIFKVWNDQGQSGNSTCLIIEKLHCTQNKKSLVVGHMQLVVLTFKN